MCGVGSVCRGDPWFRRRYASPTPRAIGAAYPSGAPNPTLLTDLGPDRFALLNNGFEVTLRAVSVVLGLGQFQTGTP